MNAALAVKRIHRLKREWVGDGMEVIWTRRGLDLALKEIRQLAQEQALRNEEARPHVNRWYAADLYHAIVVALNKLKRAERGRAIRVLELAVARVSERPAIETQTIQK